jgi:hypothetical protein
MPREDGFAAVLRDKVRSFVADLGHEVDWGNHLQLSRPDNRLVTNGAWACTARMQVIR